MSSSCCHAAYIINVPAKDEECFYISTPKVAGTVYGNYELLDDESSTVGGSSDALSVVVLDSSNQRVLHRSRRGSTEGTFKVDVSAGQKVQICIQNGLWIVGKRKATQNRPHDGKERVVGLHYSFEERNVALELQTQSSTLLSSTKELYRQIGRLQDHYGYMRAREAKHREVVEGIFSKLMVWTMLQGSVVILVAVAQIMYFRRFLERRRYI